MQPLSDFDLFLNFAVAIGMPLLILANLMNWGANTPFNIYLWREHPNLMRVALVILGLLALNALVTLAGHYGIISQTVVDYAVPVLGIPFLITSVAIIWLSIRALLQYLRGRRSLHLAPAPRRPQKPHIRALGPRSHGPSRML